MSDMDALRAVLAPLGYPVHDTWKVGLPTVSQYVIVSGVDTNPPERPLGHVTTARDYEFRVKVVAATVAGVRVMLDRVRQVLAPAMGGVVVPDVSRLIEVRFVRAETVDVDNVSTTVPVPFGVDTYRLVSQPLA